MQISSGYAYEKAPDQEHFLGATETRELFKKAFANGNQKRWRLNRSPLFLDFLEGKTDFGCTAWGIPAYSLLGWQKPCYRPGPPRPREGPALRELYGAAALGSARDITSLTRLM